MGVFTRDATLKGARIGREKALRNYYENPNYCLNCGLIIDVRDNEQPAITRVRKFCNRSCAAKYNNRRTKKKPLVFCLYCGKKTHRRCKYCSVSCRNSSAYKLYIDRWLDGKESGNRGSIENNTLSPSNHVRRWMRETRGEKCEKCGWDKIHSVTRLVPVQIHHKDGNKENTVPDNIEFLCPNCHSLTENYCGLNVKSKV